MEPNQIIKLLSSSSLAELDQASLLLQAIVMMSMHTSLVLNTTFFWSHSYILV